MTGYRVTPSDGFLGNIVDGPAVVGEKIDNIVAKILLFMPF